MNKSINNKAIDKYQDLTRELKEQIKAMELEGDNDNDIVALEKSWKIRQRDCEYWKKLWDCPDHSIA